MADDIPITFHTSYAEVRAAWNSLCTNGGYSLYADADGNLHALRAGYASNE